jgi:2-dehydro-3-deoxy-D-arabinonate dehydratase
MTGIKLYRTAAGPVAQCNGDYFRIARDWDELLNDDALHASLAAACAKAQPDASAGDDAARPLAPIGHQEVWASGVTYQRSRAARVAESRDAGGGDFYDRVYAADRPELFFKATPDRVVGPGEPMHLRRDSRWIVPEPELTLAITRRGTIVGWTVGNDLSCRDIEGENPLYLPQAKTFDRCAALGPCILVAALPPGAATAITVTVRRSASVAFSDSTTLGQMKRRPDELVEWLFRDNTHAAGCFLMTGTGIVPPDDMSLVRGDIVEIAIDGIGLLSNPMD